MIKNCLLIFLAILMPLFLFGQRSISGMYVTVLLEDQSRLTGDLIREYISTIVLDIDGEPYRIQRKDILGIVPKYIIDGAEQNRKVTEDLIVLKNKTWLPCEILEIDAKEAFVKINNYQSYVSLSRVETIYPVGQEISLLTGLSKNEKLEIPFGVDYQKDYLKKEWYHVAYVNVLTTDSSNDDILGGIGIQYVFGYQFTKQFGVGFGMGYIEYASSFQQDIPNMAPIFGEIRGYLSDKKASAYYNLAIGMSLGTRSQNVLLDKSRPKMFTHPAFGYKIGSDKIAFMMDLGLQIAGVEYTSSTEATQVSIIDVNRLVLRIGLML